MTASRPSRPHRGFTLPEMVVVVVVIGLLAALAAPALIGQRARSNDAAARSLLATGSRTMESHFAAGGTYAGATPAALAALEPSIGWRTTAASAAAAQVRVTSTTATRYTLSTVSRSGTTYTYAHDLGARPTVTRSCSPAAGCAANGTAGRW